MNILIRPVRVAMLVVMFLAVIFMPVSAPTFATQPAATNPCLGGSTSVPPTGSITGHVTFADTGKPAVAVFAFVYIADGSTGSPASNTQTDNTGAYTITNLYAGAYVVRFEPSSKDAATYAEEYFNDKATIGTATRIDVADNTVTRGIDEALERGTTISGKVVAGETGQPLPEGVSVDVYEAVAPSPNVFAGYIFVQKDGTYTTPALKAGNYKVRFTPDAGIPNGSNTRSGYLQEYYNGKPSLDKADVVQVNGTTPTTGINATLSRGGTITGTVTAGGQPLSNIGVQVESTDFSYRRLVDTDNAGKYSVNGLPSNSYRVRFYAPSDSAYPDQYYNKKPSSAQADPVVVTAPNTVANINGDFQVGGRISGRVTDPNGAPLADSTYVFVFDSNGNFASSATTDATGTYTTGVVLSGSYRVKFINHAFAVQFYNNKPSLQAADPVLVTAPNITPNINAKLAPGGCIGGHVTDAPTGKPIASAAITVYDSAGNEVAVGRTNPSGNYTTFVLLAPGSYRVKFSATGYADQYFDNKPTLAGATPIVVTADTKATANGALGPAPTAKLTYLPLVKR